MTSVWILLQSDFIVWNESGNMQINRCGFVPIKLFLYRVQLVDQFRPWAVICQPQLDHYPMLGSMLGKDLLPLRCHFLSFISSQIPLESYRPLFLFPTRCYLAVSGSCLKLIQIGTLPAPYLFLYAPLGNSDKKHRSYSKCSVSYHPLSVSNYSPIKYQICLIVLDKVPGAAQSFQVDSFPSEPDQGPEWQVPAIPWSGAESVGPDTESDGST